jgi:NAD(P)-dependent dehydrogenase (short-subunit alcohol dehydrogenase family)
VRVRHQNVLWAVGSCKRCGGVGGPTGCPLTPPRPTNVGGPSSDAADVSWNDAVRQTDLWPAERPLQRLGERHVLGGEAVLAVNLTGTFNVTRLSIPYLRKSPAGVILIMSSVGGRFGYPERSPYATTKRGLLGLTETLALELGDAGIRVNAIAPGAVNGERIQRVLKGRADSSGRSLEDVTAEALGNQAIKRFVDPDDIAALALFLASDSAKSISGQTIAIDGDPKAAQ